MGGGMKNWAYATVTIIGIQIARDAFGIKKFATTSISLFLYIWWLEKPDLRGERGSKIQP